MVARPLAVGAGADDLLLDPEAGLEQGLAEPRIRPRRPDRQHAAGLQCRLGDRKAARFIQPLVLRPDQRVGAVVDVEQDQVEPLSSALEALGLTVSPSTFRRGTMACTGIEFCKLAIVETKAREEDKILYIRADKNLEYSKVQDAVDIASKAGVRVTGLISEQTPGSEGKSVDAAADAKVGNVGGKR